LRDPSLRLTGIRIILARQVLLPADMGRGCILPFCAFDIRPIYIDLISGDTRSTGLGSRCDLDMLYRTADRFLHFLDLRPGEEHAPVITSHVIDDIDLRLDISFIVIDHRITDDMI
jgi:hypothetical protein